RESCDVLARRHPRCRIDVQTRRATGHERRGHRVRRGRPPPLTDRDPVLRKALGDLRGLVLGKLRDDEAVHGAGTGGRSAGDDVSAGAAMTAAEPPRAAPATAASGSDARSGPRWLNLFRGRRGAIIVYLVFAGTYVGTAGDRLRGHSPY